MVKIGNLAGRKTMAIISDMSQPLGVAVGNALEVEVAIETLKGNGPKDLEALCIELGSQMVYLGGKAADLAEARELVTENLRNGKALEKFKVFVASQGGNPAVVDDYSLMPQASRQQDVLAEASGYVTEIVADDIGVAAMLLGAGRATKESTIDLAAGLKILKKVGDPVQKGEAIVRMFANKADFAQAEKLIQEAYSIGEERKEITLIHGVITD
jgi:pyrimidine-nucleoside phosphorylase